MEHPHRNKIIIIFSLLLGWIVLSLSIYEHFFRFYESDLVYIVHDVPPFYKDPFGMAFVYIKPGNFLMGNEEDHPFRVYLTKGFYIQKTEVTQGQWKDIMANNPSRFSDCGEDCPVEMISYKDAITFIDILNIRNGTDKFKYRLPTEAEWEYTVVSGNNFSCDTSEEFRRQLKEYCWHSENSLDKTHPVAGKKPNHLGIYDLHGNVNEWCVDSYYHSHIKENVVDPVTRSDRKTGGNYSIRGGSWRSYSHFCRSGTKSGRLPDLKYNDVGLRLVIEIENTM